MFQLHRLCYARTHTRLLPLHPRPDGYALESLHAHGLKDTQRFGVPMARPRTRINDVLIANPGRRKEGRAISELEWPKLRGDGEPAFLYLCFRFGEELANALPVFICRRYPCVNVFCSQTEVNTTMQGNASIQG